MEEQRSKDKLGELEAKYMALESIVDGLQWHHRNDKLQEQITALAKQLSSEIEAVKTRAGVHDREALEKIGNLALELAAISAKLDLPPFVPVVARVNGNGDMQARMRWMERLVWGALGAVAAFEFFSRVIPH